VRVTLAAAHVEREAMVLLPESEEVAQTRRMPENDGVLIAEIIATLSYAADLGLGQPMEHCLRQTVIGQRIAAHLGASQDELEATYYLGLLSNATAMRTLPSRPSGSETTSR